MSAISAPDRSAVVAQRLAEAAQIESEWNAMSYKDRASWWMSAKWYGYQSTDAYRRGDDAQANESCRYGEPGFFIATRVSYFEAQAAVAEIVATATATATATAAAVSVEPAITPPAVPTSSHVPPTESVTEPVVAEPIVAADQAANILREAVAAITSQTSQPSITNNQHKKKKKKHHGGSHSSSTGAGKTIEISLGR